MRRLSVVLIVPLSLFVVARALASFGGGGHSSEPSRPTELPGEQSDPQPRDEASRYYGDGYDLVAKAKQDLTAGKAKNAEKRFRKALERGERAVEIDSSYYEAWNLVGFCARQLKDYDRSMAAYDRCLRIKPDYAPAREYLGEAYLELGKNAAAREQLAWLDKAGATEESGRLKAAIDVWENAHPGVMIPTPVAGTIEAPAPRTADDSLAAPADTSAADKK